MLLSDIVIADVFIYLLTACENFNRIFGSYSVAPNPGGPDP